eukprot:TRINITY_DN51211_c0_g1_i1.p1 TRINITY_DN51211_c0_g1~~TRINITY_DN51211_c0_g1_i1.p1  ORF type:complete len:353 (+),score=41.57 TRINITY_DN51211_c0_g1_i1:36-1061(+)
MVPPDAMRNADCLRHWQSSLKNDWSHIRLLFRSVARRPHPPSLALPQGACLAAANSLHQSVVFNMLRCTGVQNQCYRKLLHSRRKTREACGSSRTVVDDLDQLEFDLSLTDSTQISDEEYGLPDWWFGAARRTADLVWHAGMLDLGMKRFGRRGERSDQLLELLVPIATDNPSRPLRAAEIGVFRGETSERLLSGVPSLRLILVDPYEGGVDFACSWADRTASQTRREMLHRLKPYRNRTTLLQTSSVAAAAHVSDGSLDLVFIDGNHSFGAVREDILAWAPKVRPGGILSGHDMDNRHPGVVKAVLSIFRLETLLFASDSVWMVVAPPVSAFSHQFLRGR